MTTAGRTVALVDAFTDRALSGNVAGVVPDAEGISPEQMQAVARELNASETAFVQPSGSADRRMRFFSPSTEVDLCGHATVAAHAYLFEMGAIGTGEQTMETEAGEFDIDIEADGTVWMAQQPPEIQQVEHSADRVADDLGIDPSAIMDELPVARASTGLAYLIVPLRYLSQLGEIEPDPDRIRELAESVDAVGIYACTFDTLEAESTLHGRAFVPGVGITEDPVTGTASGAAGAYLRQFDAFDTVPEELRFEQGHYVDRPGLVRVRVDGGITVGGRAVTALDGHIEIPATDSDDIIIA